MLRDIPPQVAAAIERDDVYALRMMGRKGGRISQRNRDIRKAVAKEHVMRIYDERMALAKQANENLVPIDDSPSGNIFTEEDLRSDL